MYIQQPTCMLISVSLSLAQLNYIHQIQPSWWIHSIQHPEDWFKIQPSHRQALLRVTEQNRYEVCLHDSQKTYIFSVMLGEEIFWLNIFKSAFCFQELLFQPSSPISHLIGGSRSAVLFLSLPSPIFCHGDFMKSLITPRKSLIRFRKLSRRSTMTRPWRELSYMQLWKGEVGELAAADVSLRKIFITNIAAEVENVWRENVMQPKKSARWKIKLLYEETKKEWSRTCQAAQRQLPWLFDYLRQRSHCWCVAKGQRVRWLASASSRRPPRRSWKGYE